LPVSTVQEEPKDVLAERERIYSRSRKAGKEVGHLLRDGLLAMFRGRGSFAGRLDHAVIGIFDPRKRLAALLPAIDEAADGSDQITGPWEATRRIAWRVIIEKNTSRRFVQLAEVGVRCPGRDPRL
jgi:hypothetical protein